MTQIHVLDQQTDEILDATTQFWNDNLIETLENEETFEFSVSSESRIAPHLTKRNRVIIPVDDGFFREFIVDKVTQLQYEKEVYTVASYIELKKAEPIAPTVLEGATVNTAMDYVLEGTGWQRGITDYAGTRRVVFEEYLAPYNALKQLTYADAFNLELRFRIEIVQGNKVVRYVDMLERVGEWRGKEIVSGKDLISAKRTELIDNVVTALYGIGPERQDGTRDVVVVTNEEARQAWGRNGNHLWDKYSPETEDMDMSVERLTELTENELEKRINSVIQYEVEGVDIEHIFGRDHEKVRMGDSSRIKATEYNPPIFLESRVIRREGPISDKTQRKYTLGEFIDHAAENNKAAMKAVDKQITQKINQIVQNEDWIAPSLLNGWTNYGSGFETAGYYKDSFGVIHLKGLVTTAAETGTIFILPEGYRPKASRRFPIATSSDTGTTLGTITIETDGSVMFAYGGIGWVSLEGISFRP